LVLRYCEKLGLGSDGVYREDHSGVVVGDVHLAAVFVLAYLAVVMLVVVLDREHWLLVGRGQIPVDYYQFEFLEDRVAAHLALERFEAATLVVVA